ncbi:MAG: hypothetical protein ACE5EX_03880, partial [Phycisphaerae bacterium]
MSGISTSCQGVVRRIRRYGTIGAWMLLCCAVPATPGLYARPAPVAEAATSLLSRAVPQEVIAVCFIGEKTTRAEPQAVRSALSLVALLADQARAMGLLAHAGTGTRLWIDAAAALSVVLDHPVAAVLLDVRSRPREDGGHELAEMKAALIVLTGGAHRPIERRIQHLLSTYTNSEETTLSTRSLDDTVVTTIQDRRLPAWALIEAAPLGDYFVISIGKGALTSIVAAMHGRTGSLATDDWAAAAMSPSRSVRHGLTLYARLDRLLERVDRRLAGKIRSAQVPLGMAGTQRLCWSVGSRGRSVESTLVLRRHDRDRIRTVAGAALADRQL